MRPAASGSSRLVLAARRCARVVLTARNHEALKQLADEIKGDESNGGMATFIAADVADEPAMRRVAAEAISRFGRIDTWVNGAGVSVLWTSDRCVLAGSPSAIRYEFLGRGNWIANRRSTSAERRRRTHQCWQHLFRSRRAVAGYVRNHRPQSGDIASKLSGAMRILSDLRQLV